MKCSSSADVQWNGAEGRIHKVDVVLSNVFLAALKYI